MDNRNQDYIAILHLCAFGLDANFSWRFPAVGGGVLDEVVYFDIQVAAVEGNFVLVPLAEGLFVGRVLLFDTRVLGRGRRIHREPADVPDVADTSVFTLCLDGARPDNVVADRTQQHSAVALGDVTELESKNIVGVIGSGADVALGLAFIVHYAVFDAPDVPETVLVESPAVEVFSVEQQFCLSEVVRQALDADVLKLDGHRRAGVKLQCEDTFHCPSVWVVVEHFDCLVAVEDVNEMITSRDDGVFVPALVFVIAGLYQSVPVGDFADDDFIALFVNDHNVADIDHPAAATFVVEEADLALFVFDLGLVAGNPPFTQVLTSVLDTGVAVVDAELYPEDEIF